MKKLLPLLWMVLLPVLLQAQLLEHSPNIIQETTNGAAIIANANFGNKGLQNYTPVTDVYVHTAVITNLSTSPADWKYNKFTWATTPAAGNAVSLGGNRWQWTIPGNIRDFYGLTNPAERILRIAILFRNGNGTQALRNADGSDMYVNVYEAGYQVRISEPFRQPFYNRTPEPNTLAVGNNFNITAKANQAGLLRILHNGNQLAQTASDSTLSVAATIAAPGDQTVVVQGTSNSVTRADTLRFFVSGSVNVAPLPAGVRDGINYRPAADSVILVLHAPGKSRVSVLGDFTNWQESASYQMNRTPDGERWWIRIGGLTAGQEYAYQYLVNGTLKIADPYTEKVLDPNNDQFISASVYPNLKPYPSGLTSGIVSVLQTAKPAYNWQVPNFTRPDKRNLVIYELLVRDFSANHTFQVVRDSIAYLKKLGINAIQLMPVNEFEGNESWGYNGSFFFATDKYYGPENQLRALIDVCHQNGIAVILDIALNHQFGQSPMVQLYWDAANNRPAANSPWFNPVAKHAFNVGYDMNHESEATKLYTERVIEHWLTSYKIDGFRWDLSKGFTQTQTCDNSGNNCDVGGWGNYDQSRVNIWTRYNNKMQAVSNNSYCILEHFGANNEEIALSNLGMLLWGNMNYNFNEGTMGFPGQANFSGVLASVRGWQNNHLIGFAESHDEERLQYRNRTAGNTSNSGHNVRNESVGIPRLGLAAAFLTMAPGPKMIWQFGELGYDYSINTCSDGVTVNNNCRLANKPVRWDYLNQPLRRNLYNTYSKLLRLRQLPNYQSTFTTGTVNQNLSGNTKWMTVSGDSLKVVVVGNFDVLGGTASVPFPETGIYYSPLGEDSINITTTSGNTSISLAPGEYRVYTRARQNTNVILAAPSLMVPTLPGIIPAQAAMRIYPNPASSSTAMVSYDLPRSGQVQIVLMSADGKVISQLVNGRQERGRHQVNAAAGKTLQGGLYRVVLRYDGLVLSQSLLVQP